MPISKADIAARLMPHLTRLASGHRATDDSRLCDDLGFDSLDSIDLVMSIEEEFRIEIPDADWENGPDRTVGEVVDLIAAKLDKGGTHAAA